MIDETGKNPFSSDFKFISSKKNAKVGLKVKKFTAEA